MDLDIEILNRYITDKATLEERKQVLAWLSAEETADAWLDHAVPSDRLKQRFMNSIRKTSKWKIWFRVAAIVIPFIILSGGICFLADRMGLFSEPEYAFIEVPCGEQMQVLLQDGTLVHLNSASRIRYPKKMGLFDRKVELSGEAYFHVAKDDGRPFIVDLDGINVRVTGTQFAVKAYPDESYVQVLLDEGGVLLEDNVDRKYLLKPGDSAGYNRNTGLCNISKVKDRNTITGWRSHSLNFYRTPFSEILKTLERQFDVSFRVEDKDLLNVHFSLSTSKVHVMDILEDLAAVSNISFTDKDHNGKTFIVSSKEK